MSKTIKMGRGHLQRQNPDGTWRNVGEVSEFSFTPRPAKPTPEIPDHARRLRYCPLCSCVTSFATGACEFSEWHEQPRSD